jgi:hypothetical protein
MIAYDRRVDVRFGVGVRVLRSAGIDRVDRCIGRVFRGFLAAWRVAARRDRAEHRGYADDGRGDVEDVHSG